MTQSAFSRNFKYSRLKATIIVLGTLGLLVLLWQEIQQQKSSRIQDSVYTPPPLTMKGGDPYIRALMRSISASEAKDSDPYTLLYGGQHVADLSRHPNQCMTIVSGPHQGKCTTAAGRYQLLTPTWLEKVQQYHPPGLSARTSHSFEPQVQDAVVYAWLNDHHAWGTNITDLLKQGKLDQVLRLLSGTWTSLGYGTEDNSITPLLPQVYQKMLAEELAQTNLASPR